MISVGFGWMYSTFTPLRLHTALAEDVDEIKLLKLRDFWQGEVLYLKSQDRKLPGDADTLRQLKKAEEELSQVKARIKALQNK